MTIYNGIDINSNNNVSDWNKVKNAGIQVVINKATEGNYYQDKYLKYRYNQCKNLGIKLSVYHFCGKHGARTEMDYFLSYINGLNFDAVLFLDIEQPPQSYGWQWTKQTAVSYLNEAIPYLQSKGYKVGIYTGTSFYNDFLRGNIPNVVLWLASYGSQPSLYPNSASWQYTESGTVSGVDGNCDKDYFIDNIFTGEVKPISDTPSADVIARCKSFVGNRCLELQQKLNKIGYKLVEDGDFGINTYNSLIDFQKNNGLAIDGMAGSQTFAKLDELINKPMPSPVISGKYDETMPTGDNIFPILNSFYIEKRTDGGMGIHLDRGNYIVLFKGKVPQIYWNNNNGNYGNKSL